MLLPLQGCTPPGLYPLQHCTLLGLYPLLLQGRTTQDRTPLQGLTSQNRKSGRYVSYWNAFLFQCTFLLYLGLSVWWSGCWFPRVTSVRSNRVESEASISEKTSVGWLCGSKRIWSRLIRLHLLWMPQIPFAFECESEPPNVQPNCYLAAQTFSHHFRIFYWKWPVGNFVRHFKIENIYFFECEWPNGNSNNLSIDELPFGHSHWNLNANGNWII